MTKSISSQPMDLLSAHSSEDSLEFLLTVDEVASLLKVPKSWIYEHTRKRGLERLPHIKLGKYLRFIESDVRAYLNHHARNR